eukprot:2448650-Pyramimonas_sp.AAC.1
MKVTTLGSDIQRPVDTRTIRMQLSMRGNIPKLLNAMRDLLEERLVVIQHGQLSDSDFQYSKRVFDTFLPERSSADKFRRHLITRLWNGSLRRADR